MRPLSGDIGYFHFHRAGVAAVVVVEPEPGGHVLFRIVEAPVSDEARASVRDAVVVGGPMLEVTPWPAGSVGVRRRGT